MTKVYEVRVLENFSSSDIVTAWKNITDGMKFGWFQSPQWILSCWQTFGRNISDSIPLVIGIFSEKELVAIAPWYISENAIRCIGDPLNDLNCLPTHPKHDANVVFCTLMQELRHILKFYPPINRLFLDCWSTSLPCLNDAGFQVEEQSNLASPVLELRGDSYTYLEYLEHPKRRKVLQTLRRFYRAMPYARLEVALEPPRVLELGFAMLQLREETLDPRGMLTDCEPTSRADQFREMLASLVENRTTPSRIIMGAMLSENKILASGLYFHWDSILMKYMQGWALENGKWSPGTVLDFEMIRFAISSGVQTIEFGRGDERYKFGFGAQTQYLHNYILTLR